MSSRLAMLQMARLAPKVLGPSADRVAAFVRSRVGPEGAAADRGGRPDLYYTVFALDALTALGAALPSTTRAWLVAQGDGDGLDLVHVAALARAWAAVGDPPPGLAAALLARLRAVSDDGDFGSVYRTFLGVGAGGDLGTPLDGPGTRRLLDDRLLPDGAYADTAGVPVGTTPVTAAAVVLRRELEVPIDEASRTWLRRRLHPDGGFLATPDAPLPDLLSTAVALHALDGAARPIPPRVRDRCLDFVDTLWTGEGFCATWADDEPDVEYAFYALLALGHLAS